MEQIEALETQIHIIESQIDNQSQLDVGQYHTNYQNYFQKTLLNKIKKQIKDISEEEEIIKCRLEVESDDRKE